MSCKQLFLSFLPAAIVSMGFFNRMVSDPENPLVLSILHASSTAYSHNPDLPIEEVVC